VGDAAADIAVLAPLQVKVLECLEGKQGGEEGGRGCLPRRASALFLFF
jgi:hypothetical protein